MIDYKLILNVMIAMFLFNYISNNIMILFSWIFKEEIKEVEKDLKKQK